MSMVYCTRRLIKEYTVSKLFYMAFAFFLLLFFVDTMNAQPLGPDGSRLIGTIQSENFSGAVFSDSKGEQSFYRTFDTLPDGSQLIAVRADSISLKGTDGASYDMYIAHDMTISPAAHPAAHSAAQIKQNVPAHPVEPASIQNNSTNKTKIYSRPHDWRGRSQRDEE